MLYLTPDQLRQIIAHCQSEAPNEACGFLSGLDGRVAAVHAMTNIEPSPTSFLMDPREQIRVFRELDGRGEDLVGIYHSHPIGRPLPSRKDVEMAFYPESYYVILSLEDGVEVRAFRIVDGHATEVAIQITPQVDPG